MSHFNSALFKTVVAGLCTFSLISAQPPEIKSYPFISVKPFAPEALNDSVTLQVFIGSASNSCMAPTFTNQNFSIAPTPIQTMPTFNLTVTYTTIPVPPGKICPLIYAPVDYGPLFKLGRLNAGQYRVMDNGALAGTFTVTGKSIINNHVSQREGTSSVSCFSLHDRLVISTSVSQNLSIKALRVNGSIVPEASFSTKLSAGGSTFLEADIFRTRGVYIVQVNGEKSGKMARVIQGINR